jgi:hypothetical protein
MKVFPTLLKALAVGLLASLAPVAMGQTTTLSDSFNRNGPIADSTPDLADSNFPGTWSSPGDAAAIWNTTTAQGGRLVYSGITSGLTRLPFAPLPGFVYTLSVTINIAATPNDMWMSFGFDDGNTAANSPASPSGPWSLVKPSGAVECFANGTSTTIVSLPAGTANRGGTNNLMQMVLDTTGANWSMRLLVNGSQKTSHTFLGQPNIAGVVLGEYAGSSQLSATNTSLSVTAFMPTAPEITIEPVGFTNWLDKAASISVSASGAQPISYQWLKNGAALSGNVADSLQFPALIGTDSGAYSVIVSNSLGAVTSHVAVAYVETSSVLQISPKLSIVRLPAVSTDASSDIGEANVYLTALDFGSDPNPILVGGVPFQMVNPSGTASANGVDPVHGGSWSLASASGHGAGSPNFTGEIGDASGVADPAGATYLLLSDDTSTGTGNSPLDFVKLSLGGLTSGGKYSLRYYYRQLALEPGRPVTFDFNGDGSDTTLKTDVDTGGAYYLKYDFTASTNSVAMTMTQGAAGKGLVLYGLTLQQTSAPAVPPSIISQPIGLTNWVDLAGSLSVSASGALPLSYQWFRGGTSVAGLTGASIDFAALTGTDSGDYTVVVANSFGSVTSGVARVFVVTNGQMDLTPSISIVKLPAFDTDAATRIGTTNIYLSALDFGSDTAPLSVNGVDFQQVSLPGASSASGTDATYGGTWSITGNRGTNGVGFANAGAATTEADGATASLLADFSYLNSGAAIGDSASLTLGRLVPGGQYALRYYYRRWSGDRPIRFTFNGHGTNETVRTDIDLGGAYFLEYDFTAASTNVTGTFEALRTGNGPHIYGVTLHQTAAPAVPPTIVAQPAGITNWSGLASSLSLQVAGALPLHYQWWHDGAPINGANSASLTLTGLASANDGDYRVVVTNASGSVTSSVAKVLVVTGDLMQLTPTTAIRRLPAAGTDGASTLDATNTYLAALDFGSDTTPLTINGVTFQQLTLAGTGSGADGSHPLSSGTDATYGGTWSLAGSFTGAGGFASHSAATDQADGAMASLLADFTYLNGTVVPGDSTTLTLGGIKPGGEYVLRYYYRKWDVNRVIRFTLNGQGSNEVVQTDLDLGGAYCLEYAFTATSTDVVSELEVRVAGNGPHIYGVTLQQTKAAPDTVTLVSVRAGNSLTLSWDAGHAGYILESADSVTAAVWNPVSGVVGNSVTVDTASGTRFYRLKNP